MSVLLFEFYLILWFRLLFLLSPQFFTGFVLLLYSSYFSTWFVLLIWQLSHQWFMIPIRILMQLVFRREIIFFTTFYSIWSTVTVNLYTTVLQLLLYICSSQNERNQNENEAKWANWSPYSITWCEQDWYQFLLFCSFSNKFCAFICHTRSNTFQILNLISFFFWFFSTEISYYNHDWIYDLS